MAIEVPVRCGGKHPETAALRNTLAELGVRAPHTGEPFSEAMLLGIGGGLGGGYWVFEFGGVPSFIIGTRHSWEYPQKFLAACCERIGARHTFHETTGAAAAARHLEAALAAGQTPIVWADLAHLPYYFLPTEWSCYYIQVVRVVGTDAADRLLLDDRAPLPWVVDRATFAAARAAIRSMKQRLMVIESPSGEIDLEAAVEAGISACYRGLVEPPIKNFGLPALAKWADLVANEKDKKGWPRVFPPGRYLYLALMNTFHLIETIGTGGGGLRPLYADFLEEASQATGRPALCGVAEQYRELGRRWTALAEAALPESAPALASARRLLRRKLELFEECGPSALVELEQHQAQLCSIEAEVADSFPLSQGEIRDLFADLRAHLQAIHAAELQAAEALKVAMT